MNRLQMHNQRRKRLIALVITLCCVILIAFTVEGIQFFRMLHSFHEKNVIERHQPLAKQSVTTFLLLGLDNSGKRRLSTTRTDGMMVAVVNRHTKTITLCSLLRDTFTKIYSQQYHGYQRIEAAYTYGGDAAAVATVEHFLKLPIDYYTTVNWDGFIKAIDDVGPLKVKVDRPFIGQSYWGRPVKFKAGMQPMSGARALAYARERHVDNDQYRGFRQQAVLCALIKQLNQGQLVAHGNQVMHDLKGQLRTNLTEGELVNLMKQHATFQHYQIKRLTFQWRTFDTSGRSMVEVYPDSQDHVAQELQAAAGLRQPPADRPFLTNGHYRYATDETVQTIASERKEDTAYGQPHTYVGHAGNTKTGRLPIEVQLENGFRASDQTSTSYRVR